MPLVTRASAADLTSSSVTLQPKRFQLFQPMGGVRAKPFSRVRADGTQNRIPKKRDSARQRVFFLNVFMQNLSAYSRFIFQGPTTKLPAIAGRENPAPDERKNHEGERCSYAVAGSRFSAAGALVKTNGLFPTFDG